jgi:hypothetical protein
MNKVQLASSNGGGETTMTGDNVSDDKDRQAQLKDPEPISLALALYAAVVSTAGLALQLWNRHTENKAEQSRVRLQFFLVDKGLNRLEETHRQLTEIYATHEVLAVSTMGERNLEVDENGKAQVQAIRETIFDAWTTLEDAFEGLANLLDEHSQDVLWTYQSRLTDEFDQAKRFDDLRSLIISLANMLTTLSEFIEDLGHRYDYRSAYSSLRRDELATTVERLHDSDRGSVLR